MDHYAAVLKWPLAEALLSYEHRLKERARHDWEVATQQWAALAATGATKQKKPPDLPKILREV